MSDKKTVEVAQTVAPVAPARQVVLAEDAKLLDNKFSKYYLDLDYTLVEGFATRNRDEAKDKAEALRKDGKLAVYCGLTGGWFGILSKVAPEKEAKAAEKVLRPTVACSLKTEVGNFSGSTKEARQFARLLLESAKNAEFDFDLAKAQAEKSKTTEA